MSVPPKTIQKIHSQLQKAGMLLAKAAADGNNPRLLRQALEALLAAVEFLSDAVERLERK